MPADLTTSRLLAPVAVAAAFIITLPVCSSGQAPDAPEAAAHADALESQGMRLEAEAYLRELMETEPDLSRDAALLLKLASITDDVEDGQRLLGRVMDTARDSDILGAAHRLRADYLRASRHYMSAAREYESAARHLSGAEAVDASLRRADCLIAADDASAAEAAYRAVLRRDGLGAEEEAAAELGVAASFIQRGQPSVAAEHFARVAEKYEDRGTRLRALAGAAEGYQAAGVAHKALRALTELVEAYPESFEAVLARGRIPLLEELAAAASDTLGESPDRPDASDSE